MPLQRALHTTHLQRKRVADAAFRATRDEDHLAVRASLLEHDGGSAGAKSVARGEASGIWVSECDGELTSPVNDLILSKILK